MATIPIANIVQWCGMSTTTTRNRIIPDMMSPTEGLKQINGETLKETLGTFRDYSSSDKEDGNIILTRVQQSRLVSLMDLVKDRDRLEEELSFPDGTTGQELIHELEEATTRKKCSKEQNKFG